MKAPTRTPQEKCPSCGRQIFVDRLTGRFFAHCTEDPIETTQEGEFVGRRSPTWERENECSLSDKPAPGFERDGGSQAEDVS